VSVDDNNGELYTFTTLTPLQSPWNDNLENGSADWTVVAAEESELNWTLGVPNNGADATSPVNAWGTSLDGGVASLAESVLVSPGIYLTGGDRITLRFRHNYDFIPSDDFEGFEFGIIELYTNLATAAIPIGTISDSSFGEWKQFEFDLTPYREQLVYVAWHYVLFSIDFAPRFGWLLDDISITASNVVPGTVRITNNLWQARYVVSGPRSRVGQGASLVFSNAPPGEYRITFGDVPFHITPPPQTNTLASLGTVTFNGNYTMTDANHNDMSDAWEQHYFGTVSPNRTRTTDSDGDQFTDYDEFMAGTNPTAANSKLELIAPVVLSNGTVRLEWVAQIGRAYRVEGSSDAIHWAPVSNWIQATAGTAAFTMPTPADGQPYLFRIAVSP
jgi:hypothetical protein